MAEAKHILVVDDHFEMLEFLRSMLEMSNQDYEVLAVPSAEEGLFELQRAQFDLIISDVRLPGMSGFDLVRRIRRLGRNTPVIMITGYSSAEGKKEADSLNVYRYFKKPLDTDNMLTAVHTALHGDVSKLPVEKMVSRTDAVKKDITSAVRKRLETLRADTGAAQLMLATVTGDVIYADGNSSRLNMNGLAEIISRNIKDSFLLAEKLESDDPFSLQYHAGGRFELYCANVGHDHFLALFFETSSRRGRIGTIWLFTQRAIKDIVALFANDRQVKLPQDAVEEQDAVQTPDTVDAFLQETFDVLIDTSVADTAVSSSPSSTPPPVEEVIQPTPPEIVQVEPVEEKRIELSQLEVDDEDLLALLGTTSKPNDDAVDLDAFWDDALTEQDDELSRGMTLEEARKQGLIPSELTLDDESE